jgi:hypothetical protein
MVIAPPPLAGVRGQGKAPCNHAIAFRMKRLELKGRGFPVAIFSEFWYESYG